MACSSDGDHCRRISRAVTGVLDPPSDGADGPAGGPNRPTLRTAGGKVMGKLRTVTRSVPAGSIGRHPTTR